VEPLRMPRPSKGLTIPATTIHPKPLNGGKKT
jgi:hypothetical protein